jgi:hypothetical protein
MALGTFPDLGKTLDESFLLKDPNKVQFDARPRHHKTLVPGLNSIPETRQQIGDGIGHPEFSLRSVCSDRSSAVSESPRRLRDARNLTLEGKRTEAQTAHVKCANIGPGTTAERATVLLTNRELGLALRLGDHGFLRHTELLLNPQSGCTEM